MRTQSTMQSANTANGEISVEPANTITLAAQVNHLKKCSNAKLQQEATNPHSTDVNIIVATAMWDVP